MLAMRSPEPERYHDLLRVTESIKMKTDLVSELCLSLFHWKCEDYERKENMDFTYKQLTIKLMR